MKKLKCTFTTVIMLSFILTSCGKETETYDLSPESMMEHAFESTEDGFFGDWGIDKETAEADTSTGSIIYTLNETYEMDGRKGQLQVQFDDKKWRGTTYQFIFSDADSYLEDAYTFLYQYDKELNEKYGEPQEVNGSTFLKSNETFEDFKQNIEKNDTGTGLIVYNMGDLYQVDEKVISASMRADQENALVEIQVFAYQYRPVRKNE